ncbi:hypothetical protein ARMSODRAFT_229935 [Armillaria solidipes]|uniref:Fungal-type protein kinase domain-containing protein n=1 Tax=Armillaria solidipes TaxID=1076256 RepID=A0A2H3C5F0_9AGAR|nr:hypothetical protein ARMSODRAFT_229935 [Armillaria solidipes]
MLHSASTPYRTRVTSMVDQEARSLLLGREMVHHTLGRMPVQDFLDKFLPECPGHPDEAMLSCNNAFDAIPKPERNKDFRETSMYGKITEAFNAGSKRCPSISFFTGDGGGYAIKHSELPRRPSTKRAGFTISNPGLFQMFWQGKVLDFASDKGNDFLFEHITDPGQKNQAIADFGQMTFDAVQMLNTQFRDFTFSVSMTPHTARLLRWDRSGVIVSRAINYRRNPRQLCLFLWRFGNATDAQRGIDVDVHKATGEQEALFKRLIKEHVILQENLAEDSEVVSDRLGRHYEAGKVFLVEVFDEGPDTMTEELSEPGKMAEDASDVFSTSSTPKCPATETARPDIPQEATRGHQFLVSRPVTLPRSLVSRSIKGYWAVDVQSSKVMFLKDCWRSAAPGVVKEGNTLALLGEKGVTTGIPTVVCHGDVRSVNGIVSSTATSRYIDNRWCQKYMAHAPNNCHISPRVHYRLVTGEAGYTLEESIAGTKELIKGCQSVFDILCTVERKAGIIHYDVSSSSIILVASGQSTSFGAREALLVDWELSAPEGRDDIRKWRRTVWNTLFHRCLLAGIHCCRQALHSVALCHFRQCWAVRMNYHITTTCPRCRIAGLCSIALWTLASTVELFA